jgi:hypothetical protein
MGIGFLRRRRESKVWQRDVLDFINAAFLNPSILDEFAMPTKAFFLRQ